MRKSACLAVLGLGLALAAPVPAQEKELTPGERKEMATRAQKLAIEGQELYQAGQPGRAVERWLESLELAQRLFPRSRHPDGHLTHAFNHGAIGMALYDLGRPEQALGHLEQALAMR